MSDPLDSSKDDHSRDLRSPDHLPNVRPRGDARDPSWLPVQRRGTSPQMIGRYPDYDVLESVDSWDDATRRVIEARLTVSSRRVTFFTEAEQAIARRFCDLVMAQDREPRIPVMELIDEKMAKGELDGFHFDDMPDDRVTWHRVLAGLDATSRQRCGVAFAHCDEQTGHSIVEAFSQGELCLVQGEELNVARAWSVCLRAVLAAFYSHPWAWNEMGFGGPAYPHGYMRLGPISTLDPHESPGATSEDPVSVSEEFRE